MPVFISYAHADKDFVTQLIANLKRVGVQTWVDFQDIPAGANWDRTLQEGLNACESMIVVLTPEAVESRHVMLEWDYFLELDKPIFPLLRKPCDMPFRLRLHQFVDFTAINAESFKKLLDVLGQERHEEAEREPFEPTTMLVPAGPFLMGTTSEQIVRLHDDFVRARAKQTEFPQRTLDLPDFWIGRYPVTVAEFAVFVRAGGYSTGEYWSAEGWTRRFEVKWAAPRLWDEPRWTGDDRLPVIGVSWYEAQAYCRWLADQTGRAYRLPLEAEWEKAARGTAGRVFPWGDTWEELRCNTAEARLGHTTPVGQYSPKGDSPYGVSDMSGNVWEWCRSGWVDEYVYPEGWVPVANGRVVRGGAWDQSQDLARGASRHWRAADDFAHNIGFRVVWCAEPIDDLPVADDTRRMAVSPPPPEPITDVDPDARPPQRPDRRGLRRS